MVRLPFRYSLEKNKKMHGCQESIYCMLWKGTRSRNKDGNRLALPALPLVSREPLPLSLPPPPSLLPVPIPSSALLVSRWSTTLWKWGWISQLGSSSSKRDLQQVPLCSASDWENHPCLACCLIILGQLQAGWIFGGCCPRTLHCLSLWQSCGMHPW